MSTPAATTPTPRNAPLGRDATLAALEVAPPTRWLGSWGAFLILSIGSFLHVLTHPLCWFSCIGRTTRVLGWLLARGFPIIALVATPFGSFLAMQAFFKATFTEASGAVVILGMIRFIAPVTTGLVLMALLASRMSPRGIAQDGPWIGPRTPDGDLAQPPVAENLAVDTVGWALGAGLSGVLLAAVGMAMASMLGCLIAGVKLGVPWMIFLSLAIEMFHPLDGWSLVVQSCGFGLATALIMTHEVHLAARCAEPPAVFRAVLFCLLALHLINAVWFQLGYMGGSPFTPELHELSWQSSLHLEVCS